MDCVKPYHTTASQIQPVLLTQYSFSPVDFFLGEAYVSVWGF